MKASQLLRWSGPVSTRTRASASCLTRHCKTRLPLHPLHPLAIRRLSIASIEASSSSLERFNDTPDLTFLPSPPTWRASQSAKLAALHARLALPARLRLETLARTLVDPTADPSPAFNNESLGRLGHDILGYHTSEYILARYPRLPLAVIFASVKAYVGDATLTALAAEWGVESAAVPGGEVDPGLLQFRKTLAGNADLDGSGILVKELQQLDLQKKGKPWQRGLTSLATADAYFGDERTTLPPRRTSSSSPSSSSIFDLSLPSATETTLTNASARFVRALCAAIYLNCGRAAAKAFFRAHIEARRLDVGRMFEFRQPTRDLSRLCAREGFEAPIARIVSETGRASRTPVFVVAVFSGRDKLGEGSGASLNEGRFRAAVAALKSWYLYSPLKVRVPSEMEGAAPASKVWAPLLIDGGEVIV